MKLRNKRTGEIIEWEQPISYKVGKKYYSLAELSADWEDYEEPEEYWTMSCGAAINCTWNGDKYDRATEAVGLKFDTKEECERAIEKLKAWKRLKNARFEFGTIKYNLDEESSSTIAYDGIITIKGMAYEDFVDDLDLLFGGEE